MNPIRKRLYMIQACKQQDGFTPLPYSIGVLAAYAWSDKRIRDNYELCAIIGEKFDWTNNCDKIDNPDVIAFSCYLWNYEYNKSLAKIIKERFPKCVIIFGGHSIPIFDSDFLAEHPYVDYIIHGEGEIPFTELLLSLCEIIEIQDVHNISFRKEEKIEYRYDNECIVEDYPSPYLTGLFEQFYDFDNGKYTATLETNRGCPFHCAYCDWGLNGTKLRKMDLEKVLQEIEWMGKHHIITCFGADSNFGIFNRDIEIIHKFISTKKEYGYPRKFSVSYSKQSDDRVMQISTLLNECGAHAGATLSFQSLNPKTLAAIGRKNLSLEYYKNLICEYNKKNISTYSELILALPMETYDSFVDGLCTLLEQGQYRYINVYDFTLLINSELSRPETVNKYGLKTIKIPQRTYYSAVDNSDLSIREISNIVVETKTLSRIDWVRCKMFSAVLKGFHSFGILMYVSTYLNDRSIASYRQFYENLLTWIMSNNSPIFSPYSELEKWLLKIAHEDRTDFPQADIYKGFRVPAEEVAFLKQKEHLDCTYEKIFDFLKFYQGDDCWEELIRFQKLIMNLFYKTDDMEGEFEFDFIDYFNSILSGNPIKLSRKRTKINSSNLNELLFLPKKIYVSQI